MPSTIAARMAVLETLPPNTRSLVRAILEGWPEHEGTLEKSFSHREEAVVAHCEETATLIQQLCKGDYSALVAGYRWMCDMVFEEELVFRRTGSYRYSSFDQVNELVYQSGADMTAYMDGLLASEVLWVQHARCLHYFVSRFLPQNTDGYRHLEVGPGHGILFFYAARDPRCASLTGWDISPSSLRLTRHCLDTLGVTREVELQARNVMEPVEGAFDSIAISEVCEHLDDPVSALRSLSTVLAPGGRMYINVPINAPAIDHITLLRTPEEALEMVEAAGLSVIDQCFAPPPGYTLEKARKRKASVSIAMTAIQR